MPKTIQMSASLVEFFTKECEQVHALCDRALVPRELEGSALSMAQRVAILEGVCTNFIAKATGAPTNPLH